ncbi:MAG: RsiV family protein [Geminicoccaceae bacterium]
MPIATVVKAAAFLLLGSLGSACAIGPGGQCQRAGGTFIDQRCDLGQASDTQLARAGLIKRDGDGRVYRVETRYALIVPEAPRLEAEMRAIAIQTRAELGLYDIDLSANPSGPRPWTLQTRFEVAAVAGPLVSLIGQSVYFTGGAHSNRHWSTRLYDRARDRLIQVADLFVRPETTLPQIADVVRGELVEQKVQRGYPATEARTDRWLAEGTDPNKGGLSFVTLEPSEDRPGRVDGLRFWFAPYHVGPFVDGDFSVFVPAAMFRNDLKPAYRPLFVDRPADVGSASEGEDLQSPTSNKSSGWTPISQPSPGFGSLARTRSAL